MFHQDGKVPLLLSRAQDDDNIHHGNTEWVMGLGNLKTQAKIIMDLKENAKEEKELKGLPESRTLWISPRLHTL